VCLFIVHVGSDTSPLSFGIFLPLPLLQNFPLLVARHVLPLLVALQVPPLLPSPAGLFIYSSVRDYPPPLFGTQGTLPSLLCVFFIAVIIQFVFFSVFPGWGLVCPGGYADLAQGCLWEYHEPLSSPGGLLLSRW
jgi:hypothetical protein